MALTMLFKRIDKSAAVFKKMRRRRNQKYIRDLIRFASVTIFEVGVGG